ncbi:RtcB family protein [Demequina sp. TTPB684]|uniref:RtcB family protein n=1 Tax=unclassified Demequina TaxID=2620311 RepID=UPI001CF2924B|nr:MULTISPECIES: RtcB family protein [unclassified Demequina]MCB2413073.1 RtcB family protein [Demequina sp. TTPB684]UPU88119.1 RtcB family protein [Demequina sp. TMPB413]
MEKLNARLLNWASILDPQTKEQAITTSSMPFIYPHLALMPDAHLGLGATVGSVIPTLGAIIPAAVGVDIGCGMIAVKTQFTKDDVAGKDLGALREQIERSIPLSAGGKNQKIRHTAQARIEALEALATPTQLARIDGLSRLWRNQLGTLGSGNHFIEVSLDEDDAVWFFLHSGSRGVGNKIAQHHIAIAHTVMSRYWITLPDKDLAYLVEGSEEFDEYIADLTWAQAFALANREEMMDRVVDQFERWMGAATGSPVTVEEFTRINCHHNFSQQERHWGKDVWVSRKGAILAREGEWGLIPGSMGTASYVVQGLGNAVALNSSPHGAGRVFSRTAARKQFTREDLRASMVGIEYKDSDAFIDEIPAAYKDIDQVMADAADLVEIRHTLRQIVNVKGD